MYSLSDMQSSVQNTPDSFALRKSIGNPDYVIFWYNRDLLDEWACSDLTSQIRSIIGELGGTKIVVYPWSYLDVPLVMTLWGRLQRFETFDAKQAKAFYRANINKAPELNALCI